MTPGRTGGPADKAEDAVDKATKGKYSRQIDRAGDKAADYVEELDDK